jgi:hypothetical protein
MKWLNTRGNTVLNIAICDRCKMKRAYSDIVDDGNIKGLRVCTFGCSDVRDPYRLPARQPEKISVRFPRPDANVDQIHDNIIAEPSGDNPLATESGNTPTNGNLNELSP